MDVESPFTFSMVFVRNYDDEPVVLDGVRLIEADPTIRLVDALAASLDGRSGEFTGDETFPPDFPLELQPLAGFSLEPTTAGPDGSGALVVLGLEVTAEGASGFRGIAIEYHQGERSFEYQVPFSLAGCAPAADYARRPGRCNREIPTPIGIESA